MHVERSVRHIYWGYSFSAMACMYGVGHDNDVLYKEVLPVMVYWE